MVWLWTPEARLPHAHRPRNALTQKRVCNVQATCHSELNGGTSQLVEGQVQPKEPCHMLTSQTVNATMRQQARHVQATCRSEVHGGTSQVGSGTNLTHAPSTRKYSHAKAPLHFPNNLPF